jgi:hypothetical protein
MSCRRPPARPETASSRSGGTARARPRSISCPRGSTNCARSPRATAWTAINRVLEAQVAALTQARKAEAAELGRILSDLMAAEAVREEEARNA